MKIELFRISDLRDASRRDVNEAAIRGACLNAYLGGLVSVCRVLGRFSMFIHTDDRALGIRLLMEGVWEIQVTELIARILAPGMVFLDVGANYGYFSVLAGALVGSSGRVICIEPNPGVSQLLRDTLRVNGMASRSEVHELALGDVEDTHVELFVLKHKPMTARCMGFEGTQAGVKRVSVKASTLDELLGGEQSIDVIKIDIEGSEESFWRGAQKSLGNWSNVKIIMEVDPKRYIDPLGFYRAIESCGFVISVILPSSKLRRSSSAELAESLGKGQLMLYLSREFNGSEL